jgi:hypothetical protein
MFLARRPTRNVIDRFARITGPAAFMRVGRCQSRTAGQHLDSWQSQSGTDKPTSASASRILAWKQFDIGWVETFRGTRLSQSVQSSRY